MSGLSVYTCRKWVAKHRLNIIQNALTTPQAQPKSHTVATSVLFRLRAVRAQVKELEAHGRRHGLSASDLSTWMPEYAAYMIEACPGKPFEGIQARAGEGGLRCSVETRFKSMYFLQSVMSFV